MMRAVVCSLLTAGMLICMFCGSLVWMVFAFVLPWQLIAAIADPDNPENEKSHQ